MDTATIVNSLIPNPPASANMLGETFMYRAFPQQVQDEIFLYLKEKNHDPNAHLVRDALFNLNSVICHAHYLCFAMKYQDANEMTSYMLECIDRIQHFISPHIICQILLTFATTLLKELPGKLSDTVAEEYQKLFVAFRERLESIEKANQPT